MPGGDGTGPMGMGPMTGRAAGFCVGFGVPGPVFGRGRGFWGRGGGRGHRNWYYATGLTGWQRAAMGPVGLPVITKEQEVEALKAQAEVLAEQLDVVKKRIGDLAAAETQEK